MPLFPLLARLFLPGRRMRLRTWGAVLGFRLALWLFPLPRIRLWLEKHSPPRPQTRSQTRGAHVPRSGESPLRIGQFVVAASRWVPRSTCLVQALAAHWLLRRENFEPDFHVGVSREKNGALEAHAWVECEGVTVVGGGDLERYTPILRWHGK